MINRDKSRRREQRGYTLLEYCAGAAIIAGILWAALNTLGGNLNTLLEGIGTWATQRANDLNDGSP